jgi:hypothetical protein
MSWFERHEARIPGDLIHEIARYIRAAGVDRALQEFSGAFGVRRFMIRFSFVGGRVTVNAIDSLPLQVGGGPPPADPTGSRKAKLEVALTRLYHNMYSSLEWSHGTLGYLRDADNQHSIVPFFDEDAQQALLTVLPSPEQGHPMEDPEYRRMLGSMEAQFMPVMARSQAISPEWDHWEIDGGQLRLIFGSEDQPTDVMKRRCQVLATFSLRQRQWKWQVDEPLFSEKVFCWESFVLTFDAAMELGLLVTTRLGGDWLFVSEIADGDLTLFVSVWEQ